MVHLKPEAHATPETSKTKLGLGDFLPDHGLNKHNINYDLEHHNHHHFYHHHDHHDKENHNQTTSTSVYSSICGTR